MGTEYKTDNSLGDYITGLASGHAYNVWSGQGAQHHQPYTPPPLPQTPAKEQTTLVPMPPVKVPVDTRQEDYSVMGHDYSGPYGVANWLMDHLFRALFKVEKVIIPHLLALFLAGSLAGVMAAIYFELSLFPLLLLNLVTGAAIGMISAGLALVALKLLATATILTINIVMVFSIFGMMIAGVFALVVAAIYVMSFFFPELVGFFAEW